MKNKKNNNKINIGKNTMLYSLLNIAALNEESSLTIDEFNEIIQKSEQSIIDEEDLLATANMTINGIGIDFNDIISALNQLFNEIGEKLEINTKVENINKEIELGIQSKIENEYADILENIKTTHQLLHINNERIEAMYPIGNDGE